MRVLRNHMGNLRQKFDVREMRLWTHYGGVRRRSEAHLICVETVLVAVVGTRICIKQSLAAIVARRVAHVEGVVGAYWLGTQELIGMGCAGVRDS